MMNQHKTFYSYQRRVVGSLGPNDFVSFDVYNLNEEVGVLHGGHVFSPQALWHARQWTNISNGSSKVLISCFNIKLPPDLQEFVQYRYDNIISMSCRPAQSWELNQLGLPGHTELYKYEFRP